ncbi:MAG: VWA domain-containing protein [Acidobacteriaceae bacterium]|jgi:VWFA-related protein
MFRSISLTAVSLLSIVALAQQTDTGAAPPPTLKVTTRLVYVDVLVRDKSGNVVRGLTQQDFRIMEDGKPQPVQFFEAHDAAPASPPTPTAPQVAKAEFSNVNAGSASLPMTMVLFDLLNTPYDDQLSGRQQMLKFLNTLPGGERMVVFTLGNRLQMTQGLSGSPTLIEAVAKMLVPTNRGLDTSKTEAMQDDQVADNFKRQGSPSLGSLPGASASDNMGSKPDAQSYEVRARSTISALGELAKAMADYPGRKSLYWVAESYPLSIEVVGPPVDTDPSFGSATQFDTSQINLQGHFNQTSKDEMRETLNQLASARIAVYPTSIFGLASQASSAAVTSPVEFGGQNPGDPRGGFFTLNNLKVEMNDLARVTGGEAIFGTNDIAGAMRRTMDDSASYYTLAYTPTNQTWNGQFRAVRVNATGDLNLIYRRGYFATPDGSATDSGQDFERAMQPGVPEETGLRVRSRILPADPQHPGLFIESTINTADVAFATTPDGHRRAKLFVQLVGFSDAEQQPKTVPQTSGTLNIDLDPQKYEYIVSAGIAFRQQLELKPGAYRVLLGVSDQNSHKVGTIEMPITVPAS